MPRRTDIETILIPGSGPIVIGQACEFDYSGTQAVKALKREGYRIVLVNSNPATIMTDPELCDATYIEPLTPETLEGIIEREKPDALLATVGGQTALNLAVALDERGTLERYGVELIGAGVKSVRIAEDRELFKAAMDGIGLRSPKSVLVRSMDDAKQAMGEIGFPLILRASFTLGGSGSGIALTERDYLTKIEDGLRLSPVGSILVEESLLGWKEYEFEVIRDRVGNGIIVCSIENFDAMGVHTGDSITVAPAQTLTDREYQQLRDDSLAVLNAVGVATGGSNVQFAVNPETSERLVIEMNPRVSRSSALASKATGYPIAKIAALLAVGYTLDELPNEITGTSSACFEPSIDYTVVKVPRWSFDKFPDTPDTLGTTMRSVGEVMAIGRTFREALQKSLRALELGLDGWGFGASSEVAATGRAGNGTVAGHLSQSELRAALARPSPGRLHQLYEALRRGMSPEELCDLTGIDGWFLDNLAVLMETEGRLRGFTLAELPRESLWMAKREGFSDRRIAQLLRPGPASATPGGGPEPEAASTTPFAGSPGAIAVKQRRLELGITPVFRRIDTCAAEFEGLTPYLYATWEDGPCEAQPTDRRKVIVLGSGPNRIGQGIEFDTCCCHAVAALQAAGIEAILINCNPETVSTDYDLSDRLYFEPLRTEEVLHIIEREQPEGVIVSLGGQTPLKLSHDLHTAGVTILGTPVDAIDRAENRDRFGELLDELDIAAPAYGTARTAEEAFEVAEGIGYPVMVRPSYVLGGQAMRIVYNPDDLRAYFDLAARVAPEHPVLIDRFLEDAVELDVDAVSDGTRVVIGGILQHIEEAGVHSGDSFAVLPPYKVTPIELDMIRDASRRLALALGVVGLVNIQFAILEGTVYVIEVNPRASRTVPFIEKATGMPLVEIATRCMIGQTLDEQGVTDPGPLSRVFVKAPVFPFRRFPETDRLLGPEMRSTGEVMGVGSSFGIAFAKAQLASGLGLPTAGTTFISVNDRDKPAVLPIARDLVGLGFRLLATRGTAAFLRRHGLECEDIAKVGEDTPHIADRIHAGEVQLVINTPLGRKSHYDEVAIRRAATVMDVGCITTLSGARAAVDGIRCVQEGIAEITSIQSLGSSFPVSGTPNQLQ